MACASDADSSADTIKIEIKNVPGKPIFYVSYLLMPANPKTEAFGSCGLFTAINDRPTAV
jgi:hypothetical protein